MKKLFSLLSLWLLFAVVGLAQGSGPITVTEADGSPVCNNCRKFVFANGSLTVSGNTVTIAGGGGSGTVTSVGGSFTGGLISVSGSPVTTSGTLAFTVAGTSGGVPYFSSTSTWASSPLLVANALMIGGGAGNPPATTTTGTGVITALGVNTGSAGAFVVNGGALGTPSSGTATNLTGLPISTGVSGLGTGVATFLATPSSANLAAAVTDETGSGALVFGTSPTITSGLTLSQGTFTISGDISAAAWTTNGIRYSSVPATLTDTTSSGTVAAAYTNAYGGNTIAASSSTTYTNYFTTFITQPTAGSNVTFTNRWALGLSGGFNQTSTAANAFVSGANGATNPTFTINNSVASQASGITVTGQADGTAPTITVNSRTQGASALAGNGLAITADPAIAGNTNAGAAAGGSVTITAGNAARLTSGDANGGNIVLAPGAGIGTSGRRGQVTLPVANDRFAPALAFAGFQGTGFYQVNSTTFGFSSNVSEMLAIGSYAGFNGLTVLNSGAGFGISFDANTSIVRQANAVVRLGNGSTGAGSLVLGTSTVGSIGTSGVGVLAIANGTAPTSSPADEFQLYSADSAAGDANAFARNEAGEVNRLTGLSARNSSSFAKTSDTTLANITGLTRNVEAGRTYAFSAVVQTTAAATGGVKFAVSGTATATSISYEGILYNGAAVVAQTRATALNTTVCAVTNATAATCKIEGVIVVNAAGTLTLQFAQNASDGSASTVLVNQFLRLVPIS